MYHGEFWGVSEEVRGIYSRIWLVSGDLGRVQGSRALLWIEWCQEVGGSSMIGCLNYRGVLFLF